MNNEFKFWLGTLVAYTLVILYALAVFIMIQCPDLVESLPKKVAASIGDSKTPVTQSTKAATEPAGIENIATLVGGLISALIISILATTEPQQGAIQKLTNAEGDNLMKAWVIYIYIIIWMLTGLAALIYGTMLNKIDGQFTTTVSNIGSAWLATAISSGYAYFGLNPPAQEDDSGTGSGTGSGTVSGNGNSSGSGDS